MWTQVPEIQPACQTNSENVTGPLNDRVLDTGSTFTEKDYNKEIYPKCSRQCGKPETKEPEALENDAGKGRLLLHSCQ